MITGAMFAGVASERIGSGLWSYNRENYFWDWQNRQARDYQLQNMVVSRFGLFREDIRDLAGLTTAKLDSYLVVNTLKLGFIVTVFFNFDRTDQPSGSDRTTTERELVVLFTCCFMTAFQLLLTSIWFSMHACVLAQSLVTKMLVETVRIPFPTEHEVTGAAPEAKHYERDVGTAFRIPLLRDPQRKEPREPSPTQRQASTASTWPSDSSRSQPSHIELMRLGCAGEGRPAPHLKFYNRIMSNWQPFDVYSKICMSIGTSAFLKGMAYYSLYYTRSASQAGTLHINVEGWYTFAFMSLLAWLCVILDLIILSSKEHVIVGVVALAAPFTVAILSLVGCGGLWMLPLAVLSQASWIWLLCGSAVWLRNGLPSRWRACHYLNILDTTEDTNAAKAAKTGIELLQYLDLILNFPPGPISARALDDVRRARKQLAHALDEASEQRQQHRQQEDPQTWRVPGEGFWLELPNGDDGEPPKTYWVGAPVSAVGEGPPCSSTESTPLHVLLLAAEVAADSILCTCAAWTRTDAEQLGIYGGQYGEPSVRNFESKFRSKGLKAQSPMGWSAHRFFRVNIALVSAGWAVAIVRCGIMSFDAKPIQRKPTDKDDLAVWQGPTTLDTDDLAVHRFALETIGVGRGIWPASAFSSAALPETLLVESFPLLLPRQWYLPTSLACSSDGLQFAVADGVRAFVAEAVPLQNRSLKNRWLGPLAGCGGADVVAVSFAARGHLAPGEELLAIVPGVGPQGSGAAVALPLPRRPDDVPRLCPGRAGQSGHAHISASWNFSALGLATVFDSCSLPGLAIRNGQLMALEPLPDGHWHVAGQLPPLPEGHHPTAVAVTRGCVAFVLDERGSLFEFSDLDRGWLGPWRLGSAAETNDARGVTWKGLCALPGPGEWLLLGHRTAERRGFAASVTGAELWHVTTKPGGGQTEKVPVAVPAA